MIRRPYTPGPTQGLCGAYHLYQLHVVVSFEPCPHWLLNSSGINLLIASERVGRVSGADFAGGIGFLMSWCPLGGFIPWTVKVPILSGQSKKKCRVLSHGSIFRVDRASTQLGQDTSDPQKSCAAPWTVVKAEPAK